MILTVDPAVLIQRHACPQFDLFVVVIFSWRTLMFLTQFQRKVLTGAALSHQDSRHYALNDMKSYHFTKSAWLTVWDYSPLNDVHECVCVYLNHLTSSHYNTSVQWAWLTVVCIWGTRPKQKMWSLAERFGFGVAFSFFLLSLSLPMFSSTTAGKRSRHSGSCEVCRTLFVSTMIFLS